MMLNNVSWPKPDHKNESVCLPSHAHVGGGGDLVTALNNQIIGFAVPECPCNR